MPTDTFNRRSETEIRKSIRVIEVCRPPVRGPLCRRPRPFRCLHDWSGSFRLEPCRLASRLLESVTFHGVASLSSRRIRHRKNRTKQKGGVCVDALSFSISRQETIEEGCERCKVDIHRIVAELLRRSPSGFPILNRLQRQRINADRVTENEGPHLPPVWDLRGLRMCAKQFASQEHNLMYELVAHLGREWLSST
jgi:hypothetical protein